MASGLVIGRGLIKEWEKCRLVAYRPFPSDPWTIGWGATGSGITEGTIWDQYQADADLDNRTAILCSQINEVLHNAPTAEELGAMLSLAYNIGFNAFRDSTLLKLFNAGDIVEAADQFNVWIHSAGKVVQGLINRRREERAVFLS
mgnify:CR=1 FL=1